MENSVTILEDWNQDNDGCIWYRWKRTDENATAQEGEWHFIETDYKEKPIIHWKRLSQTEFNDLLVNRPALDTLRPSDAPSGPKRKANT